MSPWQCGIEGCGADFEAPDRLIEHQVQAHEPCTCRVCEAEFPAGFPAIHHAFTEHTRADYLRAYDADSDDIRVREQIIEELEAKLDVEALLSALGLEELSAPAGD